MGVVVSPSGYNKEGGEVEPMVAVVGTKDNAAEKKLHEVKVAYKAAHNAEENVDTGPLIPNHITPETYPRETLKHLRPPAAMSARLARKNSKSTIGMETIARRWLENKETQDDLKPIQPNKKFQTIKQALHGHTSLTVSPSIGGEKEKEAGKHFGAGDVNMEDYWLIKVFANMDSDTAGDYPILQDRYGVRIDADPSHIDKADFKHLYDWTKLPDTQVIKRMDMIEIIRFKFQGLPFDTAKAAMKWTFPEYLADQMGVKFNKEFVTSRWIEGEESLYVFDPFRMEIATDFLNEFAVKRKCSMKQLPNGESVESLLTDDVVESFQEFKGKTDEICSVEPDGDKCTDAIKASVDVAANVLWEIAGISGVECEKPACVKAEYIPHWTRGKTGNYNLMGFRDTDGIFTDRMYYKASNQPGLVKLNARVFRPGSASSGKLITQNIEEMKKEEDDYMETQMAAQS